MCEEIWKTLPTNSNYEVSNTGLVRSIDRKVWNGKGFANHKGRILKQSISKRGYKTITNHSGLPSQQVHRLVAMAFIDNPQNKPQVNHIDGNKTNNNVSNLEWCDNSENQLHAYRSGLQNHSCFSGRPRRKVEQIDKETGVVIQVFESISDAEKVVGIHSNIGMCCRGQRNYAKGYKWRFADAR